MEPDWVQHAIWWHIYPLGFLGAPQTREDAHQEEAGQHDPGTVHRLRRLVDWLDYAVELGVSGIALGPVFDSGTHGYDTRDYFAIDPRLGNEADFRELVSEAHQRGLRVLLDGVFNHVGRGFGAFQRAVAGGGSAPEARWFVPNGDGGSGGYRTFEGHDALVALNHDEPDVADFVVRVMIHWLDLGADGWRLDAAYAVPPAFWAAVLPRVRAAHPGAYFLGEVLHGDYSAFVAGSGVDTVTQYELWKAIRSSIQEQNFFELEWALQRHNGFLDAFVPYTFAGNHDVTRLASAITDPAHLAHAVVVLLTVGGTPAVYYGDEQAYHGVKEERAGGDDDVRPAFPADGPGAFAPDGWPVHRLHQELIGLRRRHSWLHRARTRTLRLENRLFVYEVSHGADRLVVGLNLDSGSAGIVLEGNWSAAAGTVAAAPEGSGRTRLTLPGHGWGIVE